MGELESVVQAIDRPLHRLVELPAGADRLDRAHRAADELVRRLAERFPAAQGFTHAVEESVAGWAWPNGASESEARNRLSSEERRRALRRIVRVRRGLTWGLYLEVGTTNAATDAIAVSGGREAKLSLVLLVAGLVLGLGAGLAGFVAHGDFAGSAFAIAAFGGFALGLAVFGVLWVASRPLVHAFGQPLAASDARAAFDEIAEHVARVARG